MKFNFAILVILLLLAVVPVAWFLTVEDGVDFVPESKPPAEPEVFETVEKDEEIVPKVKKDERPTEVGTQKASPPVKAVKPAERPVRGKQRAKVRRLPIFVGFEDARYAKHDQTIIRLVEEYNRNPHKWAGATVQQGKRMPKLDPVQVKAHMIQETGGVDVRSRTAWNVDPLQVNVPGDWSPYKKYLGLREPRRRNEGSAERNIRAGIMFLSRKGFGTAGQPAANSPDGTFDGWRKALSRYNGRGDKTSEGGNFRDAYADRIIHRAQVGDEKRVPIYIRLK